MSLSERDRAILEFERTWWIQSGSKEQAIKSRLGFSATRYRQLLASLVDSAEAEAFDPLFIRRLRRRREQQRRAARRRKCGGARARFERRPAGGGRAR